MKFFFLIFLIPFGVINCIIIDCLFGNEIYNDWGVRYTCKTRKFNTKDDKKTVNSVLGSHFQNLTDDDVTQFFAKGFRIEQAINILVCDFCSKIGN